jgi:hypothetical protein
VGQAHRLEQRPVDRDDTAGGDGQREADLLLERQGVFHFHSMSVTIVGVQTIATPTDYDEGSTP